MSYRQWLDPTDGITKTPDLCCTNNPVLLVNLDSKTTIYFPYHKLYCTTANVINSTYIKSNSIFNHQ